MTATSFIYLTIWNLAILGLIIPRHVQGASAESTQGKMNGISLDTYKGFEKNWRLVTVRFRKDTEEMRWTFANDIAWKTLEAGLPEYPEGAVFAKIGIRTSPDPQFPSSAVPRGATRYQFMVRDSEKFKSTGGWGYALFDAAGKIPSEDLHNVEQACFACHKLVENRGQVFSQPFELLPKVKLAFFSQSAAFKSLEFQWQPREKLSQALQKKISNAGQVFTRVRIIANPELQTHLFQGTLDEIRPSLEREAAQAKAPAALISADGTRYSIVIPVSLQNCADGHAFEAEMTLTEGDERILNRKYCNP